MDEELLRGLRAEVAKAMAMFCVRNTKLDNLHAGIVPRHADRGPLRCDRHRCGWTARTVVRGIPLR